MRHLRRSARSQAPNIFRVSTPSIAPPSALDPLVFHPFCLRLRHRAPPVFPVRHGRQERTIDIERHARRGVPELVLHHRHRHPGPQVGHRPVVPRRMALTPEPQSSGLGRTAGLAIYCTRIPTKDELPAGHVLVHNHVRPTRRLGYRGFRAWTEPRNPRHVPCDCGWALETGEHSGWSVPGEPAPWGGCPPRHLVSPATARG
jgi:hypothetical protein